MSTVSEKAALEAAATEAELTDAETEQLREMVAADVPLEEAVGQLIGLRPAEPTPQPTPPEQATETGEPSEAQLRKLDRQVDSHHDRVRSIMGGFVSGFEPCSECNGLGLTAPGPKPQTHDFFAACDTCQGFGDVLTGSLKAGEQSRPCPDCRGRGYLEAVKDGVPLAPDGVPGGQVVVPPVEQLVQPNDNGGAQQAEGQVTMGTPSWMGDTSLGG